MRKHVPTILAAIAAVLAITLLVMLIPEKEASDFSAVQYTLDNLEAMDIDTSKL